jgi:putative PIN family toxin of toxin-antitoxin system
VKVVLDTNVLLAAFGSRGMCEAVLAICIKSHELYASQYIIDEVRRNLSSKFKVPADQAWERIQFLLRQVSLVEPMPVPTDSCRDQGDLPVLGTLLAASADCLVTGDQDLLALKAFKTIPMLSPRTFYDRFRETGAVQ